MIGAINLARRRLEVKDDDTKHLVLKVLRQDQRSDRTRDRWPYSAGIWSRIGKHRPGPAPAAADVKVSHARRTSIVRRRSKQLPKLGCRPVECCHHGSMNILLKYPLRITDPDHTTGLIQWEPGNVEKFSLTKIDFECPVGGSLYPAWIYDSHNSPHRFNDYLVEVISQTVPGAAYGVSCRIRLDDISAGVRALDRLTKPRRVEDKTVKGINFFDPIDHALLKRCKTRGSISPASGAPICWCCSSRSLKPGFHGSLRRLCDIGVIKRVKGTYRYYLTRIGRAATAALCRVTHAIIVPVPV